ncbi:MAG TPA: glycosyltransferase family 2 protein [Planosporangium sp.]|jgi:GT2 family glycosyltransferase|nr:glycosyltransferase family 2 protein [Planosporangium sp.]
MTNAAVTDDRHASGVDRRLPALVCEVEVTRPVPAFPAFDQHGRRVERVWLLVRVFSEPVGSVTIDVPDAGLAATDVAAAVDAEHGPAIRSRLAAAGAAVGPELPVGGVSIPGTPAFLARRDEILRTAPPITVVVCTRERPGPLARCLDSLLAQVYPRFRVLVVDNAPATDATAKVVAEAATRGPVDYLLAPLPGLSHARNAAVAAAGGEVLAWLDDDEVADPFWLSEVARALAEHPEADVVSGVIVPAELETRAQVWFEQFGGHSKGRGFVPAVFSPATAHLQSPLYPLPPFGTGANMTFRPGVIEGIGGFDPALGAGTPAMGSEDTLAFTRILLGGGTIVYQPGALTWHYHRRDVEGLRRQMIGYGAGLTAAYTSLVLADPRVLVGLARLVPTALRDLTSDDSLRSAGLEADFPRKLMGANRRGMLAGPLLYLRGRLRNRRLRSGLGGP